MTDKPRIALLSGSNATIGNSPALVTSNKARAQYGLPLRPNPDGSAPRFDVLRPQRLAAPATVYVQQFSAHPLERTRRSFTARRTAMSIQPVHSTKTASPTPTSRSTGWN